MTRQDGRQGDQCQSLPESEICWMTLAPAVSWVLRRHWWQGGSASTRWSRGEDKDEPENIIAIGSVFRPDQCNQAITLAWYLPPSTGMFRLETWDINSQWLAAFSEVRRPLGGTWWRDRRRAWRCPPTGWFSCSGLSRTCKPMKLQWCNWYSNNRG